MSDQIQTTDAPVTETEQTITPEQYQALQDEVERMRKHNETLLAEKKAEQQKQREAQAEKDALAQEQARKKGDFESLEKSYKEREAKKDELIAGLQKRLDDNLIDMATREVVAELSSNPKNQKLLQHFTKEYLTVVDGEVKPTDGKGNLVAGSYKDIVNHIKASGDFDSIIDGTKASGVGATGQGTQGTKQASDYTESERIELATTNPNLFNQLFAQKE